MNLSFVGDWLPIHGQPIAYSSDPAVVGNIECVLADDVVSSGKAYTSVLPMKCIDNVIHSQFSALSLANNHVYDAGVAAYKLFKRRLVAECKDIQFFGIKDRPFAELKIGGERIAVIGCLEPCRSRGADIFRQEDVTKLICEIKGRFDKIYVYPHWGKEGEYTRWPSPCLRKLARRWIDAGAEGLFGSHSHVFQGREFYNGKPIYYSLGNFYFPHPESKLYEGTDVGLCVEIEEGKVEDRFVRNGVLIEEASEIKKLKELLKSISAPLKDWTTWKWARAVGPFNLKKNSASWRIRLRKNFVKTLPKFLLWQVLPKILLFRIASLCR